MHLGKLKEIIWHTILFLTQPIGAIGKIVMGGQNKPNTSIRVDAINYTMLYRKRPLFFHPNQVCMFFVLLSIKEFLSGNSLSQSTTTIRR